MEINRRTAVAGSVLAGLSAAGGNAMAQVQRARARGFAATSLADALASIGPTVPAAGRIEIGTLDIAEDGAAVPVTLTSRIPGTVRLYVLIEKNPNPLAAVVEFPPGTSPFYTSRFKMNESGDLVVLAEAQGQLYLARRQVRVTLGACGG